MGKYDTCMQEYLQNKQYLQIYLMAASFMGDR